MAESGSRLGRFLSSAVGAALTDEELVRLEAEAELELAKDLARLESEGPLHRDRDLYPETGARSTGGSLADLVSELEGPADAGK